MRRMSRARTAPFTLAATATAIAMCWSAGAHASEAVLNFEDMTAHGVAGSLTVALAPDAPRDGRVSATIYATPKGGAYVSRGIEAFEITLPAGVDGVGAIAMTDQSLNAPSDDGGFAVMSLTLEDGQITGGAVRFSDGVGAQLDMATERSRLWVGRRTTLEGDCAEGCELVGAWSGEAAPDTALEQVRYEEPKRSMAAALALFGALSGLLTLGLSRPRKGAVRYF